MRISPGSATSITPLTNYALESGGNLATVVANQTNTTQQTKITDGTNIASVLKSDGTAAGQNSQMISGTYLSVAFTTTSVQAIGSTDAGNYRSVSVHITTQGGSSTVNFQGSNDNTNWVAIELANMGSLVNTVVTSTTTAAIIYAGGLSFRYFRLSVTGIVSGTTAGTIVFHTQAPGMQTVNVGAGQVGAAQAGTWSFSGLKTNNNAVPGATNLGVLPAVANVAQPTWTETDQVLLSSDLKGNTRMRISDAAGNDRGANVDAANNLGVNAGLMPAGTALNTYSVHLTSNTTTTPTSSTAYISMISISSEVAGTTSTVTIQDKQGTPLKLVNGLSTTTLTTTPTTVNFQTPAKMVSGIDIITAGAVAATIDVWINYFQ